MSAAHEHNRRAWDKLVRDRQAFTRPARDAEFSDPLSIVDGCNWLGGDIRGKQLLCLAAGGGRQSALYAAAGGQVTVVDISAAMFGMISAAICGLTAITMASEQIEAAVHDAIPRVAPMRTRMRSPEEWPSA